MPYSLLKFIPRQLRFKLIRALLDDPGVRHFEPSLLMSADDIEPFAPTELIELCLAAAKEATGIKLEDIANRIPKIPNKPFTYIDIWPGEHYKLLAGFVKLLQPKTVIEIGTAEGISALSLLKFLPADGQIFTFDIIPWKEFTPRVLQSTDFSNNKLVQFVEDLSDSATFNKHRHVIEKADLIFMDGPKDGHTEDAIIANLSEIKFVNPPIVILDDIRFLNMVELWRKLDKPRIDLGTFGHWTGTGIIQW